MNNFFIYKIDNIRAEFPLSEVNLPSFSFLKMFKKRLKQSDSSSYPDCGMDPQDVPHMFDCTAHPNDLSPVNL